MLSSFLIVFMMSVFYSQFHLCQATVVLEFNPNPVITGETVKMILKSPAVSKAKFAKEMGRCYFIDTVETGNITKSKCKLVVDVIDSQCVNLMMVDPPKYGDCFNLDHTSFTLAKNCSFLEILIPSTKELQAIYKFDLRISDFTSFYRLTSANVILKVDDKTPPIHLFVVSDAVTKWIKPNNTELAMNLNLTITCNTAHTNPEPTFTVKITDKNDRIQEGNNYITFNETVPRVPRFFFTCSVFNGFGTRQNSVLSYTATYWPTTSQELKKYSTIPKTMTLDYSKELELWRVENNPPKPISISGFNPDISSWFETGYPKYYYDNGLSVAVIKLKKDNKIEKNNFDINFKCTYQPGSANVLEIEGNTKFVATNNTNNTKSLIIALVIIGIFLVVIIGIVLILLFKQHHANKKRTQTLI